MNTVILLNPNQNVKIKNTVKEILKKINLENFYFLPEKPVLIDISHFYSEEKNLKEEGMKRHVVMVNKGEFVPVTEESREAKSLRLQQLLQNMIMEAVRSNNREVCEEIKETMLKELDYQFRIQEEREDERDAVRINLQEEHYRQIDELIRSRNKGRRKKSAEIVTDNGKYRENEGQSEKEFLKGNDSEQMKENEKRGFFKRKKRSIV